MAKKNKYQESMFEEESPIEFDPQEIVENIPLDEIDEQSKDEANKIFEGTTDLYSDKEWMDSHPILARRLREEIESLRLLIKMQKSDEVTHDILMRGIGQNPANASLYKALTTIQSTLLSIQKQIDDTKNNIQKIFTNVQQEFFKEQDLTPENEDEEEIRNSYRGSKTFIEDIRKKAAQ